VEAAMEGHTIQPKQDQVLLPVREIEREARICRQSRTTSAERTFSVLMMETEALLPKRVTRKEQRSSRSWFACESNTQGQITNSSSLTKDLIKNNKILRSGNCQLKVEVEQEDMNVYFIIEDNLKGCSHVKLEIMEQEINAVVD
jgi:hypothetical protein